MAIDLNAALPSVTECTEVMVRLWERWGNTVNAGYLATWRQLFQAFRDEMIHRADADHLGFDVYSPGFGEGKSACLMTWLAMCSKLGPEVHPGARVIVLLKVDAERFVEDVVALANELGIMHPAWAEVEYAVSWHSGNCKDRLVETLYRNAVVATCHAGFEGEMIHEGTNGAAHPRKESLGIFNGDSPRAHYIDECLTLVAVASVEKNHVQDVLRYIPQDVKTGRLRRTVAWLEEILAMEGLEGDGRIYVGSFKLDGKLPPNIRELRATLKHVNMARKHGVSNKTVNEELHKAVNRTLDSLQGLVDCEWARVKRTATKGEVVGTASTMVPADWGHGGVVLDGSAMWQRQYQHLYPTFRLIPPPEGVNGPLRRFLRALAHVAWGFNTGKSSLATTAGQIADAVKKLPSNLPELEEGPDGTPMEDGLLITFMELVEPLKKVLPLAAPADPEKGTPAKHGWHIIYWGRGTTGWNDFAKCRKVVVYGIQRLEEEHHANIERSLRPPTSDIPDSEYERRERKAEANKLFISQAIVTTLQGIGRSAFRRSVTPDGDCPEGCELYIMLTADDLGLEIWKAICKSFPGIEGKQVDWVLTAGKKTGVKKEPKLKTRNAMVGYLIEELPMGGSITKQDLSRVTAPRRNRGQMDRFVAWFLRADTTSQDFADLRDAGIRYEPSTGRYPSRFIKGKQ